MKRLFVLFIFLVLTTTISPLHAKVYKLYYLGGQSNMDGYGTVADLPAELQQPVPGVRIYQGSAEKDNTPVNGAGRWSPLLPGHGRGFASDGTTNTYSDRFGIELTFARRLRELEPATPIALLKYSRGGTSIHKDAAGDFGCWEPDFNKGNGINQYDHFLACLRRALAVRDIDGDGEEDTLVPAGILWMQGESDANNEEIAEQYQANLKRLMDLVRAALRVDDLPVVIGRISDSGKDTDGKVWDFGNTVRQAQADFCANDACAALVTSTDKYGYSDPWHYDTAGYLDLGAQFAQAMHGLQQSQQPAYVFTYFTGNGEDGLHLAYSDNGLNWHALNNGKSLLAPQVGRDRLMRDPCVIAGPDGRFHMVWTVSWQEKGIGYAHSRDLIHWSAQQYIPVMEHEPDAKNTWAPELFYDAATEQYLIFWATTIPGRFPQTDNQSNQGPPAPGNNHRMYYVTTRDFKTFSPTQLFYDRGFNVIDATLIKAQGRYVMFLKDESNKPFPPQKNIKMAYSDTAVGPYGPASQPITGDYWCEGPTVIKIGAAWTVYFDKYREHKYGALRSTDLNNWEDISDQITHPNDMRHGTVIEVSQAILEQLLTLTSE